MDLVKIREKAIRYATKRNYLDIAEDFASEVVIKVLEGKCPETSNLEWLLTDFLRKEYGSTRTLSRRARSRAERFGLSLDQKVAEGSETLLHELIASPERDPGPVRIDWRTAISLRRDGRARATICELVLDCEMKQVDVGNLLDVSEARISQQMIAIKREMENQYFWQEKLPAYRDDPDASQLSIDWITL